MIRGCWLETSPNENAYGKIWRPKKYRVWIKKGGPCLGGEGVKLQTLWAGRKAQVTPRTVWKAGALGVMGIRGD